MIPWCHSQVRPPLHLDPRSKFTSRCGPSGIQNQLSDKVLSRGFLPPNYCLELSEDQQLEHKILVAIILLWNKVKIFKRNYQ